MKMLHVTIHTDRFEDELKFYQDIVGLKIVNDRRPARQRVFLANGEGETEIEIIGETEAKDAGNENLAVGFRSEDPEKKREELIALGYDCTPMISPGPGVSFFFIKDPAGVKVQFM